MKKNHIFNLSALTLICVLRLFLDSGVLFAQNQGDTIKVGFLIRDKNDLPLLRTARMAIEKVNATLGSKEKQFQLVYRSCDGPWGVGSKKAVELIHDEKVPILVGALDGRNAHLAEQVTAKAHVVLLATQASDPTLSRAYVPWFFRMVPDDHQQSAALLEEIYLRRRATKVAIISFNNYDGKTAAESLTKLVKDKGLPAPETFTVLNDEPLPEKVIKSPWDAIVVAGNSKKSEALMKQAMQSAVKTQYYAFINFFNFSEAPAVSVISKLNYVRPVGMNKTLWQEFSNKYTKQYGKKPSPALAYVYDGITLAMESIRKYGTEQDAQRENFKLLNSQGNTGVIAFDKFGNRKFTGLQVSIE